MLTNWDLQKDKQMFCIFIQPWLFWNQKIFFVIVGRKSYVFPPNDLRINMPINFMTVYISPTLGYFETNSHKTIGHGYQHLFACQIQPQQHKERNIFMWLLQGQWINIVDNIILRQCAFEDDVWEGLITLSTICLSAVVCLPPSQNRKSMHL